MKTKAIKIIVIAAVFAFFSAGVSMAQERMDGRKDTQKNNQYSHYKQDKNHKFENNKYVKKYHGQKHYSKHYNFSQCRPVVLHNHHYNYSPYKNYRSQTGIFWTLSVVDPNMAFSIGVKGRWSSELI